MSATGHGAVGELSRRDGQLQTRSSTGPFAICDKHGGTAATVIRKWGRCRLATPATKGNWQRGHNWIKSVVGGKLRRAWGEGSSAHDGASGNEAADGGRG
jgi:hypothetical protein